MHGTPKKVVIDKLVALAKLKICVFSKRSSILALHSSCHVYTVRVIYRVAQKILAYCERYIPGGAEKTCVLNLQKGKLYSGFVVYFTTVSQ
jgi:hypothetical protein